MKKVLVANRGEIAVRIIRTLKEMNIQTVAIYSTADASDLHVALADESYCIGPPEAKASYLNIAAIIKVAKATGADAIHPGYGFLSENSAFARQCELNKITFIGPSSEIISFMRDKVSAREIMKEIGLPVIPGSGAVIEDRESLIKVTEEIGFPIIIKATSGRGGKGIRIVHDEKNLIESFDACVQEADALFGDSRMYIEKFISGARHIEVQIIGDGEGKVVHLFERDCSIQRNYQKLIEEAPATALTEKQRDEICLLACEVFSKLKYEGAGTVEFLYVEKSNQFYFMEMTPGLQAGHTITEEITGIDIVKTQIEVARGKGLPVNQEDIKRTGFALQCRINAEDPENNFRPSTGAISRLHFGLGRNTRIDTHLYMNYVMPSYYDSLLAKIIVSDTTRARTIGRMKIVLEETVIEPITTNLDFQYQLLHQINYKENKISTKFLEENDFI